MAGKEPGTEDFPPRLTRSGPFACSRPPQRELTRTRDTQHSEGRSANVVPLATTEPLFRTIAAPCALIAKFGRYSANLSVSRADVSFNQWHLSPQLELTARRSKGAGRPHGPRPNSPGPRRGARTQRAVPVAIMFAELLGTITRTLRMERPEETPTSAKGSFGRCAPRPRS